nr:hypothetical protein [Tanacetum cinerariifolium]
MSTQQDIYAAGSESRPPMLNKENYVPWSSRLLRRMIPEPGDAKRDVNVNETFHEQTDDELSEKELKQIEADDQAIQTILLGLPEDIYAAVDSCETTQEIWLRRISSNPRNRQIAQPGMNMGQDRQMQMVGGNGGNQFRQYAGQNAGNPAGYNDVIGNQVIPNVAQNPRVQNTQLLIAQKEEAEIQLQAKEYDLMAAAADLDEIKEVNANCILMANLQQASSSVVSQDIISVMQNASVVDTLDLQTELKRTKERFESCVIKKETEYAKLWNDWYKKCDECKYDKISYDKAYKDMQQKIERLQAQLGNLKGKSKDTSSVSDTRNPLS